MKITTKEVHKARISSSKTKSSLSLLVIRWSKNIFTDRALIVLQNIFLNKRKLTIWQKTNVLSGYYIVHYLVGQHSFCSNKQFLFEILLNEVSYLDTLIISDLNQKQNKFKTELEQFLSDKKQECQTMATIYYQYPSQTEISINLFGLKNQIINTKKQLKNLVDKHKPRTIRIGLDSQQVNLILLTLNNKNKSSILASIHSR